LYIFIKPFQQKADVHLAEKNNMRPIVGYLNPYLNQGLLRPKGSDPAWHITYSLSPSSQGRHYFQERIEIQKGDNLLDGLQAYLLTE
jgi:hypothetical protein